MPSNMVIPADFFDILQNPYSIRGAFGTLEPEPVRDEPGNLGHLLHRRLGVRAV